MAGRLIYLVDTNVWLEILLEQERAPEARAFFDRLESHSLVAITDFSLHSIGISLANLHKDEAFIAFVSDAIMDSGVEYLNLDIDDMERVFIYLRKFNLDFDDAYQYALAEKHDLILVSFDKHFDRTDRGRKTPGEIV